MVPPTIVATNAPMFPFRAAPMFPLRAPMLPLIVDSLVRGVAPMFPAKAEEEIANIIVTAAAASLMRFIIVSW
jgi:hypothetical protein